MAKQNANQDRFEKTLTLILVGIFAVAVLAFLALLFGAVLFAPMKTA